MDITKMSRMAFYRLPWRDRWSEPVVCDEIVILPVRRRPLGEAWYHVRRFIARLLGLPAPSLASVPHLHDSGYRLMDVVAVRDGEPVCRVSGCSDVLDLAGTARGWRIDCLPRSGLVRLWPRGEYQIVIGAALSLLHIMLRSTAHEEAD